MFQLGEFLRTHTLNGPGIVALMVLMLCVQVVRLHWGEEAYQTARMLNFALVMVLAMRYGMIFKRRGS